MSKHKHNYSQYSNKPKNEIKPAITEEDLNPIAAVVEEPKPQVVLPPLVNETVETKTLPETVTGMVVGCAKLNVRSDASLFADVVCTLDVMSEMMIDVDKSTKDWFFVCTATGIEGYCLRKYVEAHL